MRELACKDCENSSNSRYQCTCTQIQSTYSHIQSPNMSRLTALWHQDYESKGLNTGPSILELLEFERGITLDVDVAPFQKPVQQ